MAFSVSKLVVAASLATGSLMSISHAATAQTFGFEFETEYSVNNSPQGDVLLESVKVGDEIIKEFSYVSQVQVIENDPYLGGNSGGGSADKGDTATTGVAVEDASSQDILTNLSTDNLNNIVDTEDDGNFVIDLSFGKPIDNLLIWERGMNSDLGIQAVDESGNLIGDHLIVTRDMWFDAGFAIDTTEIGSAQQVGALGISIFDDLSVDSGRVNAIRFFSQSQFNGPDWKFVGTDATRAVPEPTLALGLGVLGGFLALRKKSATTASATRHQ